MESNSHARVATTVRIRLGRFRYTGEVGNLLTMDDREAHSCWFIDYSGCDDTSCYDAK